MTQQIKNCQIIDNAEAWNHILENYDNFLFDCDGVLWNVNHLFPGVEEFISKLRTKNKKILLATNNSSKAREEYKKKCEKLNLNVALDEIYCTVHVICHYLQYHFKFGKNNAFLIGSPNFAQALKEIGVNPIVAPPDQLTGDISDWVDNTKLESDVKAVIVGFDKQYNFWKCLRAVSYLKDPKTLFIATNTDELFPYPSKSVVVPGTGCIVESVVKGAGRQPWIAGKPHDPIFRCMIEEHKLDLKRTIFFGDRLNTDILGANRNGMTSFLVLSGVTSPQELEKVQGQAKAYADKMELLVNCGANPFVRCQNHPDCTAAVLSVNDKLSTTNANTEKTICDKCTGRQQENLENRVEWIPDFYGESLTQLNGMF